MLLLPLLMLLLQPCSKSEYASFDPLFWLLHSAVDRCVWLFQNNNCDGGGWVEPGGRGGAGGGAGVRSFSMSGPSPLQWFATSVLRHRFSKGSTAV